ncbi:DNA polymerase III subunit delta [Prolixibacteraceae bacterium JC049]|nr:DNA polymerase III subunit delta [Prolixibacteraceae bacterium JC049]
MMTFEQIQANLKKKIYHPVYLFMGEESYFIDKLTDYMVENVLPENEKGFNETILYGRDVDVESIISIARRYPMMATYQLVVVKEAQNVKNLELLATYMENPLESTILVLNYKQKSIDKRKKFVKMIDQKGVLLESKKIYDNQIPSWISKYLSFNGCTITPQAAMMLAEYLGSDLSKVANELDKLVILVEKGTQITADHIEKNIGISKDFNIFELQNALGEKNILKCNRIINYFGANGNSHPIQRTVSSLYFYFSKLLKYHFLKNKSNNFVASALQINPYFVDSYKKAATIYTPKKLVEIIGLLREFDMKSKGFGNVSATSADLQRELIFKILH